MNRCDVSGKFLICESTDCDNAKTFIDGMCLHRAKLASIDGCTFYTCSSTAAIRAAIEAENRSCVDCKYNDVEYDSLPCRMCRECYTKSFFEKAEAGE